MFDKVTDAFTDAINEATLTLLLSVCLWCYFYPPVVLLYCYLLCCVLCKVTDALTETINAATLILLLAVSDVIFVHLLFCVAVLY